MINSNFGRNLISDLHQQFSMSRLLLILCLLVQLSVAVIEGAYEVFVTVDSFELLESRCSECYVYSQSGSLVLEQGLCCDGANVGECPSTCDVRLIFCHLESFTEQPVSLGSRCPSYSESTQTFDFMTSEVNEYNKTGLIGLFQVDYINTGKWVAGDMQLQLMVVDKDFSVDPDDLIDQFVIPINISAWSSFSDNYSRNYSRIELTIEVKCLGDDADENCVSVGCDMDCNNGECVKQGGESVCICSFGFGGPNCTNITECVPGICNNGNCTQPNGDSDHQCECLPGFSGMLCEHNIDDCIGVTCNNGGTCVDGVATFSCVCDPGYTGDMCDTEIVTPTSMSAGNSTSVLYETTANVSIVVNMNPDAIPKDSSKVQSAVLGSVLCSLLLVLALVVSVVVTMAIFKTKKCNHRKCSSSDSDDINNCEDIGVGLKENEAYARHGFKTVKNEAYEVVPNSQEHTHATKTSEINNCEDIGLKENEAYIYAQHGFKIMKNEAYEGVPNPQEHTYATITSD